MEINFKCPLRTLPVYSLVRINKMPVVSIPTDKILDESSFHTVFAEVMGFPDFYGHATWMPG